MDLVDRQQLLKMTRIRVVAGKTADGVLVYELACLPPDGKTGIRKIFVESTADDLIAELKAAVSVIAAAAQSGMSAKNVDSSNRSNERNLSDEGSTVDI